MTYIELRELDTLPSDAMLLAWAEIWALANETFSIDNLLLDREVVLGELSALFPDEDADELAAEPGIAIDRILENLELRIATEADQTSESISFDYPFEVRPEAGVILRLRSGLKDNVFGALYLAMQMERLYRAKLVSFWNDDEDTEHPENAFLTPFTRIFEVVSAVSVANFKNGVPILVGESRSVQMALLPALQEVCDVLGDGQPKDIGALNRIQRRANDGGADAIIVFRNNQQVFECTVVGATIQQSSIRNKVMGRDVRARICNYFVDDTTLNPLTGLMTHPAPFDDGMYGLCKEGDCSYLARESIIEYLRPTNVVSRVDKIRFMRSIRSARDPLLDLSKIRFLREFDRVELPCNS